MFRSVAFTFGYLVIFALFTLNQMASAQDFSKFRPHVAINLASYHLNSSKDFNEINPGIGIGFTTPSGLGRSEFGLEVGQYKNSINSQSYYVMGSLDAEVARITPNVAIRMGGFAGFSHYPGDARKFKDRGVPTIGNWVMAAGLQTAVRVNDTYDLRIRVMPAGDVADALFTAQIAIGF